MWGLFITDDDIDKLNSSFVHQHESSHGCNINYLEFIALITDVVHYRPGLEFVRPQGIDVSFREKILAGGHPMKDLFRRLDRDGSGRLDRKELKTALTQHKIPFTDEDIDYLFCRYDTNADGLLSYCEFVKLLQTR
jgi:hypothetical protein